MGEASGCDEASELVVAAATFPVSAAGADVSETAVVVAAPLTAFPASPVLTAGLVTLESAAAGAVVVEVDASVVAGAVADALVFPEVSVVAGASVVVVVLEAAVASVVVAGAGAWVTSVVVAGAAVASPVCVPCC